MRPRQELGARGRAPAGTPLWAVQRRPAADSSRQGVRRQRAAAVRVGQAAVRLPLAARVERLKGPQGPSREAAEPLVPVLRAQGRRRAVPPVPMLVAPAPAEAPEAPP